MSPIGNSTVLHDITVYLKGLLQANVTDPIVGSRSSSSKFIMTSFPMRVAEYPLITIKTSMDSGVGLGMASEAMEIRNVIQISIWSKSTKQRDELFDSVLYALRSNQLGTGTIAENLYDLTLVNAFDLSEDVGQEKIHRKIAEFSYKFIAD